MQAKISISKEIIEKNIANNAISILVCDTVDSTNDLAKALASKKSDESVIIALHQTAGRGRRGRTFYSPDGCGIYMSMLLHTRENAADTALITSAAAVAVADAIEKVCGTDTGIKWVNDIYIDGKKACGILCESVFENGASTPEYTVVGIGINLIAPDGFPDEIKDIATSIYGKREPREDTPSLLCAAIINGMMSYKSELKNRTFLDKYKEKMVMLGKEITVHSASENYIATALDIDNDCHLIVKLEDGTKRTLSSGEISTKIKG